MKPKPDEHSAQRELFRVELEYLVDRSHPLVKLGEKVDWSVFEEKLGGMYHPSKGAPGISTRLMVGSSGFVVENQLLAGDKVA